MILTRLSTRRWLVSIGATLGLMCANAVPTHAAPPSPFPDMDDVTAWYDQHEPSDFFLPDRPGVWFLTPSGLNCGIWTWGSFGCTGDIPGIPPGDNHIAWYNGNRAVHHGWTAAIQFPAGQAVRPLPPRSFVMYESSTCAITPDGNTYCEHGANKFFVTPQGTWFKAWNDRRSQVCNAYGSCLPDW
ncbi:hypothetical protein [Mycolicibacterium fortuitum]|uniref:hypothetical protein n=1 Tax=Mycolicibacterium fortuitum TaxID=1766 RepID=UPI00096F7BDB|nr:hypothetical protein [Mycolicibacterium fortuitum]